MGIRVTTLLKGIEMLRPEWKKRLNVPAWVYQYVRDNQGKDGIDKVELANTLRKLNPTASIGDLEKYLTS